MNKQNESPFGNPRFIFAIIAVFLFLWAWQYYVNKAFPPVVKKDQVIEQNAANGSTTALTTGTQPNASLNTPDVKVALAAAPAEQTYQYEDENVKWQISSNGMGLNYYELKKYFDRNKNLEQLKANFQK